MPTSKKRITHKRLVRPVHLNAILFLIIYSLISKTVFFKSLSTHDPLISFLGPYVFGVLAGIVFLYILNHEDFFHFVKDLRKMEAKKEKTLLKKYKNFGKVLGTLVIAGIGGPIFSALTVRLLLNNVWYRYILIAVGNLISTVATVVIGFNLFKFFG